MTINTHTSNLPESRCPSVEELATLRDSATVQAHLSECLRCRTRVAVLDSENGQAAQLALSLPNQSETIRNAPQRFRAETSRLDFGAICSVASDEAPGERLLVVLLGGRPLKDPADEGAVTVAPISTDDHLAAGWDELIKANELDLAYDCMIEMWNYGQVARVQLDESFGHVHTNVRARLERSWQAIRSGAEQAPDGSVTGPPVLSELDPRIAFHRDEIERVRPFYTPKVESVRELAGSLVHLLQTRLRVVSCDEPVAGSAEADVLRGARGSGFVVAPDANALGRVIAWVGLDISAGTEGASALDEEASAWIKNERHDPALMAARSRTTRVREAVGHLLGRNSDEVAEIDSYLTTVRAAWQREMKPH